MLCQVLRPGLRSPRVPVLLQLTPSECGAACLAMVLNAFGRGTRLAECRALLDVGREGVTARSLVQAARSFGLQARGRALGPAGFAGIPLPAIAHWEGSHSVVVERWTPRRVSIIDPAVGRRHLTPPEFAASYSGVALTFEAGP